MKRPIDDDPEHADSNAALKEVDKRQSAEKTSLFVVMRTLTEAVGAGDLEIGAWSRNVPLIVQYLASGNVFHGATSNPHVDPHQATIEALSRQVDGAWDAVGRLSAGLRALVVGQGPDGMKAAIDALLADNPSREKILLDLIFKVEADNKDDLLKQLLDEEMRKALPAKLYSVIDALARPGLAAGGEVAKDAACMLALAKIFNGPDSLSGATHRYAAVLHGPVVTPGPSLELTPAAKRVCPTIGRTLPPAPALAETSLTLALVGCSTDTTTPPTQALLAGGRHALEPTPAPTQTLYPVAAEPPLPILAVAAPASGGRGPSADVAPTLIPGDGHALEPAPTQTMYPVAAEPLSPILAAAAPASGGHEPSADVTPAPTLMAGDRHALEPTPAQVQTLFPVAAEPPSPILAVVAPANSGHGPSADAVTPPAPALVAGDKDMPEHTPAQVQTVYRPVAAKPPGPILAAATPASGGHEPSADVAPAPTLMAGDRHALEPTPAQVQTLYSVAASATSSRGPSAVAATPPAPAVDDGVPEVEAELDDDDEEQPPVASEGSGGGSGSVTEFDDDDDKQPSPPVAPEGGGEGSGSVTASVSAAPFAAGGATDGGGPDFGGATGVPPEPDILTCDYLMKVVDYMHTITKKSRCEECHITLETSNYRLYVRRRRNDYRWKVVPPNPCITSNRAVKKCKPPDALLDRVSIHRQLEKDAGARSRRSLRSKQAAGTIQYTSVGYHISSHPIPFFLPFTLPSFPIPTHPRPAGRCIQSNKEYTTHRHLQRKQALLNKPSLILIITTNTAFT